MQPANIAVALRRRSPWEAIDLGLTMLQRWWRQVYAPLALVGAPLIAAAFGIAWYFDRVWLAIVLVWWLKPVYDRVVLHVLSRAVFGELARTRAVLGAWREWLGTGVLLALLPPFRFDFARSFNLAVRQLEGQRGKAARQRRSLLGRRARGYAVWLGVVCVAFEWMVLYPSFGLLLELLLPAKAAEGQSIWELMFGGGDESAVLWSYGDALAYAATVMLLEPFYVAAGFALYLNRRTLLEGWDIEVALRRIAERHAVSALLLCIGLSFSILATNVSAQPSGDPHTEIREVLKAKEFGHYAERERWRWSPPDWLDSLFKDSRSSKDKGADLRGIGYALAKAAEFALWILAGAALVYAVWFIARMLPRGGAPRPAPYRPPAALFGMALAPETLPPDVAQAAAALARAGKSREALGLLYRGALSTLVHQRGVQLLASHTELEVLRLSSSIYLEELVKAWRESAYADRHAGAADIEQLAQGYRGAFA
jgi:hypothetical protein